MKTHPKSYFVFIAVIAVLAAGCAALRPGTLPGTTGYGSGNGQDFRTAGQLQDWQTVWSAVNQNFHSASFNGVDWNSIQKEVVDRIKTGLSEEEFTALVDRTLALLKDGHTYYLDPEEADTMLRSLGDQNFTGLGLSVVKGNGNYAVIGVTFPGGPAEKAGLASHDRIHAIDGHPALGADGQPEVSRMRGPAGTKVTLLVSTPGGTMRELVLVRAQVDASAGAVKGRLLDGTGGKRIGYILYAFMPGPRAGDLFRAEFSRLSKDSPLDGLVLDLRINIGGDLEAFSTSLGLFMEGTYGKDQARERRFRMGYETSGTEQGNSRTVPLVVLVHKATASAAELMAGTLRFSGRARLAGQVTSGDTAGSFVLSLPGGGLASVGVAMFLHPDGSDPGWPPRPGRPYRDAPMDSGTPDRTG